MRIRRLTNAAGIRGDVERGFLELEKAADSNNTIKYDAQMMLMYLHEKEENYSEALKIRGNAVRLFLRKRNIPF